MVGWWPTISKEKTLQTLAVLPGHVQAASKGLHRSPHLVEVEPRGDKDKCCLLPSHAGATRQIPDFDCFF